MMEEITFRQIERQLSVKVSNEQPDSALGAWYQAVRDKGISDFEIGDVCRACRQKLYLDHLVPVAIQWLQEDPLAGEIYDGELLVALKSVPTEFWTGRQRETHDLIAIVQAAGKIADDDVKSDIRELLARLSGTGN